MLRSKLEGRLERTTISSRSADLAHKVHWTLCLKPNRALKELEMRYAISSSFKARSRSSASALSGSANRGDFSRIMQLEIVDSRYALSEKAGRRAASESIQASRGERGKTANQCALP